MPTPEQHARLSASSAERWLNCGPSVRLCENVPDETSEFAEEGRLAHSIGELKLRKHFFGMGPAKFKAELIKLKANPLYKDEMQSCTDEYDEYVEAIIMNSGEHQISLEQRVDYSTFAPNGFGTADCIVVSFDPLSDAWSLDIIDYKHGKGVAVSAENNSQLKLYALGALLKIAAEDELATMLNGTPPRQIDVVRLHIIQPRSPGGSSMWVTTKDDLIDWGINEVRPRAQLAHEGGGECNPGPWCKNNFCPIRNTCRARAKHVLQVMFEPLVMKDAPELTLDEIGELLLLTDELAPWRAGLVAQAAKSLNSGVAVPGWKLVRGRSERSWGNRQAAVEALKAEGVDEATLYEPAALKSPAQIEGLIGRGKFTELLAGYVVKPQGKPTLAKEDDRRSSLNQAAEDFGGFVKEGG